MDFFINNKKATKTQELKYLKEVFGEDWREGMRKNPQIERYDAGRAKRAKARKEQERRETLKETAKEVMYNQRKHGIINSEQAKKIMRDIKRFET